MSDLEIIRDASRALRSTLFEALTDVPDVEFGFGTPLTDIVAAAPRDDVPDSARLSVYLYHVEPDPQLRNQPELTVGARGLVEPPLALRLSYLITPLLKDEDVNQLVLGRVLQVFHDRPSVDIVGGVPLDDSRGGGDPELRMSLEPMTPETLSRIWHAMGADLRLSAAYLMRTVMIDSALAPRRVNRVAEAHVAVEQGV